MSLRASTIRIPDEVRHAIEESCRRTGRDFSSVANEMLSEAVKMRRIPGIVFVDSPLGRVARVAGTGIEIFEIARTYEELGEDRERLKSAYHWLSPQQLRAALAYISAYPQEIEDCLTADSRWTPEEVWTRYPFTEPEPS